MTDSSAYCLEITGNSMLPVYREGDVVIVSPKATIHNGDGVVVKTTDGKVTVKVIERKTENAVDLASLDVKRKGIKVALKDVHSIARIVWASQ